MNNHTAYTGIKDPIYCPANRSVPKKQTKTGQDAREIWSRAISAAGVDDYDSDDEAIAIIQSALEQAVSEAKKSAYRRGYDHCQNKRLSDLMQPRGEKWTVERSKDGVSNPMARIMQGNEKIIGWTMRPFSESFDKIADAHNASIGADAGERDTELEAARQYWKDSQALIEQLKRDTKRLDWLEQNPHRAKLDDVMPTDIREAIDAEMSQTNENQ